MIPDATPVDQQPPIDPSINWERSGMLARASAQGALFSLYLAMQQHSVAEPFEIEPADSALANSNSSIEAQLASLNHYRRPSLAANENEWHNMQVMAELVANDVSAARLYQTMKPSPLAQSDNVKRLPNNVIENCSLATQKRLNKTFGNTLKEDNTLLYDILSTN